MTNRHVGCFVFYWVGMREERQREDAGLWENMVLRKMQKEKRMGKKQKKRSLCFLVMIASIFIMQTMAYSYALEDVSLLANNNILEANSVDENKTIVSVEAFTLGLGYIVMPQYVSFIEGETAGDVLMRFFDNMNGIECDGIQSDGTFHVKKISGQKVRELLAKEIVIPEVLSSYVPNIDINDHSIDSIKNFDFTSQSGWMYCVNNIFPTCGPSSYTLEDGDIIRVQFTLALGADIGGAQAITGGDNFYAVGNKDEITEIIANYILNNENSEIPIPFLKEAEDLTGGMGRESKIVHGSFSPVGSVPELGIVVGWNIKINMDGQYTSQNGRYIYNGFKGTTHPHATTDIPSLAHLLFL